MSRQCSREPGEPGQLHDRLGHHAEQIALRDEPAEDGLDVLLEPVDDRELALVGVAQHPLLERVDPRLEVVDDREQRVGERVEHPVDDVLLAVRAAEVVHLAQRPAGLRAAR